MVGLPGVKPWKAESFRLSTDPELVGKITDICGPYYRHKTTTLFAGLSIATGQMTAALKSQPCNNLEPAPFDEQLRRLASSAQWKSSARSRHTGRVAGRTSTAGSSVTGRALSLLGAFDEGHRRLGLTELAARADLPLTTAHRLVGELVTFGALSRTPAGDYVVGRRLWDLGLLAPVQTGLREAASPYLHDLFGATRATVHLAVRDEHEVLYVDRLRGSASVPILSTVGSRLPLHATGVGKVLLAHAPDQVVAELLADLRRMAPQTITSSQLLARHVARVRRDGLAFTAEQMSPGASSVAVPIRTHDGDVIAALGIVVRSSRRDASRLVAKLREAAQGIERTLGARC